MDEVVPKIYCVWVVSFWTSFGMKLVWEWGKFCCTRPRARAVTRPCAIHGHHTWPCMFCRFWRKFNTGWYTTVCPYSTCLHGMGHDCVSQVSIVTQSGKRAGTRPCVPISYIYRLGTRSCVLAPNSHTVWARVTLPCDPYFSNFSSFFWIV